jgi:hypothetical protein
MAAITGRVDVIVNGEPLLNKAGAIARGIGISGSQSFEVTPVLGDTGLHGATETAIVAECEVTVSDRSDILLTNLANINGDGTVIFRKAGGNGKSYKLENAYCARNFELTAGEGETTVKFFGSYWTETSQAA